MLRQLWTILLDIVYPPKCPGCRAEVEVHGSWCNPCLTEVFSVREINVFQHHLKYLDFCLAVCDYTGGVKRLIHDMKFRQGERYARYLEWLLDKGIAPKRFRDAAVVMPVPLHAARLKERGYNQTDLIFRGWVECSGWLWSADNLIRTKSTQPQWQLKLSERRQNIKDAFWLTRPKDIVNKNVLLVDDIITTGTTMNECAKVLKKAGAGKVYGLALASGAPY